MDKTQHQKVLEILHDTKFHCSNEFLKNYISEYRSRINELRKRGYTISKARCTLHTHKGMSQMWKLTQGGVVAARRSHNPVYAGSIPAPVTKVCCPSYGIFQVHSKDCETLKIKDRAMLF